MTSSNHTTQHPTSDPERLEADVARQREELAETVQGLHDRLDVKGRTQERAGELKDAAQDRAHELQDRATTRTGRPRPGLIGAAVALAAVPVVVLAWRRRRASSRMPKWHRWVR